MYMYIHVHVHVKSVADPGFYEGGSDYNLYILQQAVILACRNAPSMRVWGHAPPRWSNSYIATTRSGTHQPKHGETPSNSSLMHTYQRVEKDFGILALLEHTDI